MPPTDYVPNLFEVPPEPGAPLRPSTPVVASAVSAGPAGDPLPITFADLLVLLVGVGLLVWGLTAQLPALVLVLAGAITVVGVLLPLRKLARRSPRPGPPPVAARAGDGTGAPPLLLDLADPTTARLAGAYRSLVTALAGREGPFVAAALEAGHAALVEAAELVQGRPPAGLADVQALDDRSAALEALTARVRTTSELPEALPPAADSAPEGSVARLDRLAGELPG